MALTRKEVAHNPLENHGENEENGADEKEDTPGQDIRVSLDDRIWQRGSLDEPTQQVRILMHRPNPSAPSRK